MLYLTNKLKHNKLRFNFHKYNEYGLLGIRSIGKPLAASLIKQ